MITKNNVTNKHRIPGDYLNDNISIDSDERDPYAGNGTHEYRFANNGKAVGFLQFQHGPRNVPGSKDGLSAASVIAALIDHFQGFQEGPFACRENALAITKLEEALMWTQSRSLDRAKRGVLGKNEQ